MTQTGCRTLKDVCRVYEVLTLDRLKRMAPDAAAALLWCRLSQDARATDAALRAQWLALDDANGLAWERASACWTDFGAGEDDEVLAALRADARRAGRQGIWRGAASLIARALRKAASRPR